MFQLTIDCPSLFITYTSDLVSTVGQQPLHATWYEIHDEQRWDVRFEFETLEEAEEARDKLAEKFCVWRYISIDEF